MAYRTVVANSAKHRDEQARVNVEKGLDPEQITIFTIDDCKRCEYAVEMLEFLELDYKVYNTSDRLVYNQLMWDALYVLGNKEGRIKMPVIALDNKIHFSIKDLEKFMESFAKL